MHLPAFLSRPALRTLCIATILAPVGAIAANLNLSVADGPAADATLYVALYNDAAGYANGAPVASQSVPMQGGQAQLVFRDLTPGRYALRMFADENGNGKLDTNFVGMPIERYGFSNNAKGNRAAPDFEAAAIRVDSDLQTVVNLR